MPKIIRTITTRSLIEKPYKTFGRSYKLSMGGIGSECEKAMYLGFHWASLPEVMKPRTQRIFDMGHLFEALAIRDLKRIGYFVYKEVDGKEIEMTGEVGERQEVIIGQTGHEKGKPDGRVRGVIENPEIPHLLELKTMATKYFLPLSKSMSVFKSQYGYYCQIQRYMLGVGLEFCLFIAINKNTCQYHIEIIKLDKGFAQDLCRKEIVIIAADKPPKRGFPDGYYKCNMCNHQMVCEKKMEPEINCRTCDYSELENEGKWLCGLKKKSRVLEIADQQAGCKKWGNSW